LLLFCHNARIRDAADLECHPEFIPKPDKQIPDEANHYSETALPFAHEALYSLLPIAP
jgi:hypothetical protein